MGDFFNGWRRKAGCIALVTACVFVGLWLRSTQADDAFRIMIYGRKHLLRSHQQRIDWWAWVPTARDADQPFWTTREYPKEPEQGVRQIISDDREWRHYDLQILALYRDELPYRLAARWSIPFSVISWPAIAVSAYLILWRPRKRDSRPPQS